MGVWAQVAGLTYIERCQMAQHRELILGGPGCGKTTRLLTLVEYHLKNGIHPNEIAFVAFTRKASMEAKERACALFNLQENDLPYFRTLHSFGFKELNTGSEQLMNSIHYQELGDVLKLKFGNVEDEFGLMADQHERGSQYYYLEQQARLRCIDLQKMCLLDGRQGHHYVDHYKRSLNAYKRSRKLMDYTDILEVWCEKITTIPLKVLIVDEAQDLSALQWKIIHKMEKEVPYVYYAGDDDQAIYHWAGADIQHFLSLDVQRTVLPISYRLPISVFNRCNQIVKRIRKRYNKDWKPSSREGRVSTVASPELAPYGRGNWLVLARSHYQLDDIAYHLKVKGHSIVHRGRSSLDTSEAMAVRAWLRAQQSEYVSYGDLKRIIIRFPRVLLKDSCKGIFQQKDEGLIPKDLLLEQYGIDLSKGWSSALSLKPSEKVYLNLILKNEGTLDSTPRIKLSTIHAVKGGECDNVLLIPDMSASAYESYIKDPDSESRCFYVGASRAKEHLVLCQPQSSNYFPI